MSADTMAPARTKHLLQTTPEQFCAANQEPDVRALYLEEIKNHVEALREALAEIAASPLPDSLTYFEAEFKSEVRAFEHWIKVLQREVQPCQK